MRIFLFVLSFGVSWALQSQPSEFSGVFLSPLDIPLKVSGTFGELRGDHFHSGIDFKTEGRIGLPIYSIAEGYVSRIKVSPYGFGRALYLRHPNGYTSVYAHLHRFNERIEAYLAQEQKRLQRNEVDLYPDAADLPISAGERIALGGNSGGSAGPHLHFEIRETATEAVLNPLHFGFDLSDEQYPVLRELSLYQFAGEELVASEQFRLSATGLGQYRLLGDDLLEVNQPFALGLMTFDQLSGTRNRNGVYRIDLEVDGNLRYRMQMDRFRFSETRYINSHTDYAQRDCCGKKVHRLYREPLNALSVYQATQAMDLIDLPADSTAEVEIAVYDLANNQSRLKFRVRRLPGEGLEAPQSIPEGMKRLSARQSHFYAREGLELLFPEGSFYRDIYFEHVVDPPCGECFSALHQIGSTAIPVHRRFRVSIKLSGRASGIPLEKLCLVRLDQYGFDYEGGSFRNGMLSAEVRSFGTYAVALDTLAPYLQPHNFRSGMVLPAALDELHWRVTDNLSGLESYTARVDGQWTRLYYDAKADKLIMRREDLPQASGPYTLLLEVGDDRGNIRTEAWKISRP